MLSYNHFDDHFEAFVYIRENNELIDHYITGDLIVLQHRNFY
jgi:hypothetical protein